MKYYKLIISYDGTDFFGWQSQKHCNTVQTTMRQCFLNAFAKPCTIFAASRTDTGVHARGQVASLRTEVDLDADKMLLVFNSSLPSSIRIESLESTTQDFNPHAGIEYKVYSYRFFLAKPSPWLARYGWLPPAIHKIDWEKFRRAIDRFKGQHDFTAFCRIEPGEVKQTVRSVDRIEFITENPDEIVVRIQAHSFLRYQIRRMIGAAFEVARKKGFSENVVAEALVSGKPLPPQIAFNAHALGLTLEQIVYKK